MAEKHYHEQRHFSEWYLIPYLKEHVPGFEKSKVLEIGCAEAGFLAALQQRGIENAGLELSPARVAFAKAKNPELTVHLGDITDRRVIAQVDGIFDVIVLRDVIEHVANREAFFENVDALLSERGYLYITFPPRYSPYAGHQQNGSSLLRFMPYVHLLPENIIRALGKALRERESLRENVVLNHHIGLSYAKFSRLYASFGFRALRTDFFLIRPIYKTRFGWSSRRLPGLPLLRELFSASCECLLQKTS